MLTALRVDNFKSWQEIDRMRLAPITGLFGTNSSGKTSILQLLLLLKQTVNSSDRVISLDFGGDEERNLVSLGTLRDVLFRHEESRDLRWALEWQLDTELAIRDPETPKTVALKSDRLRFEAAVGAGLRGRPQVREFAYDFADHRFSLENKDESKYEFSVTPGTHLKPKRTQGRPWPLPNPVKCYGFPDQTFTYYQNVDYLSDFVLAFENLFNGIYYLGPLREYPRRQYTWGGAQPQDVGRRGERVVDALLASGAQGKTIRGLGKGVRSRTLEAHVASVLKDLGLIESMIVREIGAGSNLYQVRVRKSINSAEALLTDVGFGVSQILPVITLCYYASPGSIVILEQPEIHLHPAVQAGLADVLIDAVRLRKIQVIVESHSEHLLTRLQRRVAERRVAADDVALYFCEMQGGVSRLTPLQLNQVGSIENWPNDFFGNPLDEAVAMAKAQEAQYKAAS